MKNNIYRMMQTKASTKGDTTTVIASTPSSDRYDDVVAPSWNLKRYEANPIVVWGHDYTQVPVGKTVDLSMDGPNLVAKIKWDDNPSNPMGETVARQFREGFLSAVSVGFAPGKSTPRKSLPKDHEAYAQKGMYFESNELLEISAVPIPANSEALALRSLGIPSMNKHLIEVVENEDSISITFGKSDDFLGLTALTADEEPEDEEPTEEDAFGEEEEEEEAAFGDEEEEETSYDDEEDDKEYDDEEEDEEEMRSMDQRVRSSILRLVAHDMVIQNLLFSDNQPEAPKGDIKTIKSLFGHE